MRPSNTVAALCFAPGAHAQDAAALHARRTLLRRLRDWFAAVERYPRQLHEMGRDEYLSMQRRELARQQAASVEAN